MITLLTENTAKLILEYNLWKRSNIFLIAKAARNSIPSGFCFVNVKVLSVGLPFQHILRFR